MNTSELYLRISRIINLLDRQLDAILSADDTDSLDAVANDTESVISTNDFFDTLLGTKMQQP